MSLYEKLSVFYLPVYLSQTLFIFLSEFVLSSELLTQPAAAEQRTPTRCSANLRHVSHQLSHYVSHHPIFLPLVKQEPERLSRVSDLGAVVAFLSSVKSSWHLV